MAILVGPWALAHPAEELLEEYCFGRVKDPALGALEEHLLICDACQLRVSELDEYITLMKFAAASPPVAEPSLSSLPETATFLEWTELLLPQLPRLAGIALAASLILGFGFSLARRTDQTETIQLVGLRGGGTQLDAHAHRGHALTVRLVPPSGFAYSHFNLVIVDSDGQPSWSGTLTQTKSSEYTARVDSKLPAGRYWVRLLAPDAGDSANLLAEYGLQVQ